MPLFYNFNNSIKNQNVFNKISGNKYNPKVIANKNNITEQFNFKKVKNFVIPALFAIGLFAYILKGRISSKKFIEKSDELYFKAQKYKEKGDKILAEVTEKFKYGKENGFQTFFDDKDKTKVVFSTSNSRLTFIKEYTKENMPFRMSVFTDDAATEIYELTEAKVNKFSYDKGSLIKAAINHKDYGAGITGAKDLIIYKDGMPEIIHRGYIRNNTSETSAEIYLYSGKKKADVIMEGWSMNDESGQNAKNIFLKTKFGAYKKIERQNENIEYRI